MKVTKSLETDQITEVEEEENSADEVAVEAGEEAADSRGEIATSIGSRPTLRAR